MRVGARLARGSVLAAWSVFFTWLWASGETGLYLGSRIAWVVPFGAVVAGLSAAALLARGPSGAVLSAGEGLAMVVLLTPIVAVLALPQAELGAAAAERRTADIEAATRLARTAPLSRLSYAHLMAAQGDVPQPGVEPGVRVRLVGFVMRRPNTAPGLFQVTRFAITCCIADAMALYATVDPPGPVPARDTWVVVTGPLARVDGELIVKASSVVPILRPEHPYVSASGLPIAVAPVRHGTLPPKPTKTGGSGAASVPVSAGATTTAAAVEPAPTPTVTTPPPRATKTFEPNSVRRRGVALTVSRVEFAATETRAFVRIENGTGAMLTVFGSNADFHEGARALSKGVTYGTTFSPWGYPTLASQFSPGQKGVGVVVFPAMDPAAPLRLIFRAQPWGADVGRRIELALAWDGSGKPE
jgi:uncharacterized repeat protein (TIGR03943 family)